MNKEQRKQNLEFIKRIRAGKVEPWEGQTALWFLNDDGDYTFGPHVIAADKLAEFTKLVGGKHLIFRPAEGCMPIGTDPDLHLSERPSLIDRAKDMIDTVIEKIFPSEQKQVATKEPHKEILQPRPLQNIAGGGIGELDMDQAYLISGFEHIKSIRL